MPRFILLILLLTLAAKGRDSISLERVVVIGASVSRGFTESEPFGGEKSNQLRLDRYLDAALSGRHGKIINDSNHLFFVSVEKSAQTQMERLQHRKPTLVIGVDFLFWFLYGHPEKTGDRLALFQKGLDLLDTLEAPMVIGDIPDTSAAIGHMLSQRMVPDAATRKEANRRLAAWAAERKNVSILPLDQFVQACESNSDIKIGRLEVEGGNTKSLLQKDRLHPTKRGCAALALAVMAILDRDGLNKAEIVWNVDKVADAGLAPSP